MARRFNLLLLVLLLMAIAPVPARAQQAPVPSQPTEQIQPPALPKAEAPTVPQAAPVPRPPERRLLPAPVSSADMVSLNFNRAELVEVVHVLAQHLKLTYTIDPEVKGTVTFTAPSRLR